MGTYNEMTASEVYAFLSDNLPLQANVYEIGCGKKSATVLKDLMDARKVVSYEGYDLSEEAVAETKAAGLEASVVISAHNHKPGFKRTADKGNGVLVMMGLPEVALDAASTYAQEAMNAGLKVVTYPELS
jgi:hypothetical protein